MGGNGFYDVNTSNMSYILKKNLEPKEILYIFNVYYPLKKFNINIELVIKYIWIIIFSKENKIISILSSNKITLCLAKMWITIGNDKDR